MPSPSRCRPQSKLASEVTTALRNIARPHARPVYVSPFSTTSGSRLTWTVPRSTSPSLGGDRKLKLEARIAYEPVVAAEYRVRIVDAIQRSFLIGRRIDRKRTEDLVARAPLDGNPTRIADDAPQRGGP